jgi:hypothetical protein
MVSKVWTRLPSLRMARIDLNELFTPNQTMRFFAGFSTI